MDASAKLHLREIECLVNSRDPAGFSPIGEVVSHIISIISIQEHRISALEQELKEGNKVEVKE